MFFTVFLLTATIAGTSAKDDWSNLMDGIRDMDIVKVKELLNVVDITKTDDVGYSVLHQAASSNGEITRLLISHGAGKMVNEPAHAQCDVSTPLFHACFTMNQGQYFQHMYEVLEAMLKAGGDPNATNTDQVTPLHVVQTGPEARLLISYGADVNAKDMFGYPPLFTCFSVGYRRINYEVLYAFAESDADFAITNIFGNTLFHMKSEMNSLRWTKELVIFLAGRGVPLDALNVAGETALTKLLKRDIKLNSEGFLHDDILNENLEDSFYAYMAEAGANLSAPNIRGETLLHMAVLNYHAGMAKWLVENGAEVDGENADGDSPLVALLKQEKWKGKKFYFALPSKEKTAEIRAVMDVLIKGGADVGLRDRYGRSVGYYLRKTRMNRVDWCIERSLRKRKKMKLYELRLARRDALHSNCGNQR